MLVPREFTLVQFFAGTCWCFNYSLDWLWYGDFMVVGFSGVGPSQHSQNSYHPPGAGQGVKLLTIPGFPLRHTVVKTHCPFPWKTFGMDNFPSSKLLESQFSHLYSKELPWNFNNPFVWPLLKKYQVRPVQATSQAAQYKNKRDLSLEISVFFRLKLVESDNMSPYYVL